MPSNGTAEEQSFSRFNERQRLLLVTVTSSFLEKEKDKIEPDGFRLDADAIASMFEGGFDTDKLSNSKTSPITAATDFIMSNDRLIALLGYSLDDRKRARKDIMEGCRYWFKAIATDPHRQSLADRPRATKSDEGLSDGDFQWLGKQLQEREWKGSQGNRRRYPGLEAMLHGCTQASEADGCDPADKVAAKRLCEIKEKATGGAHDCLDNLLKRVVLKCGCVQNSSACALSPVAILLCTRSMAECMHARHVCAQDVPI